MQSLVAESGLNVAGACLDSCQAVGAKALLTGVSFDRM
jgi:hypothetical protein